MKNKQAQKLKYQDFFSSIYHFQMRLKVKGVKSINITYVFLICFGKMKKGVISYVVEPSAAHYL